MSSHRLPQGSVTQIAQHWVDYQTGKIQKDPLKKLTVTEQYYHELFGQYNDRRMSEMTHATIRIPTGTKMMVWNDHRSFVGDMLTYIDHWKNRGEHTFMIPYGRELSVEHYSTKDISVPLVLWSTLMSHIIADRTGTNYSILDNHERYGMWVKMYEEPTYIPQLEKKIVAYGVWEQDIPLHMNVHSALIFNPSTTSGARINIKRAYTSQNNPVNKNVWICEHCGQNTSDVEYDYLSGTNHLSCELNNQMGANC